MDKALREEFRAYKVEAEDRVKSLEKAVQALQDSIEALTAPKAETKPTASSGSK